MASGNAARKSWALAGKNLGLTCHAKSTPTLISVTTPRASGIARWARSSRLCTEYVSGGFRLRWFHNWDLLKGYDYQAADVRDIGMGGARSPLIGEFELILPGALAKLTGVSQQLFGTDGVRGTANREPITAPSAMRLAQSAARVLLPGGETSRPVAIVGRDTRASGEFLESAVASGLASLGVDVLLAGIIPTPAIAYLTACHEAAFGVVISASHNPFDDNGIKFFRCTGYKLSNAEEDEIEAEYSRYRQCVRLPIGKGVGRIKPLRDAVEQYAAFAASTVPKRMSLSGLRVVVDLANGAAFQTTPLVLATLGAKVDVRYAAPDGYNINEGCGGTHPDTLAQLVRESGADLGLAHDGDADRLLLCDERGSPLDGDEILAIAATYLLQIDQLRANTVVATLMTNFGLDELMHQMGGKVLRTKVGDRNVIESMVDHNLNLGGEQSGHIIFRDFTTTGDGLISALQILSIMVSSKKSLSELRQILRKYPQVLRSVRVVENSRSNNFHC